MIKRILVAIDGTASAIHAAEYALDLTQVLKAELKIVSIINYAMGNIDAGILPQEVEKKNKEGIQHLIDNIKREHPTIEVQDYEALGIPEKEINKLINEWHADLLIIGHHTHSFLEGLLSKSIEKKLISHIECPILIIPEKR